MTIGTGVVFLVMAKGWLDGGGFKALLGYAAIGLYCISAILYAFTIIGKASKSDRKNTSNETPIQNFPETPAKIFPFSDASWLFIDDWTKINGYRVNVGTSEEKKIFKKGGGLTQPVIVAFSKKGNQVHLFAWIEYHGIVTPIYLSKSNLVIPARRAQKDLKIFFEKVGIE